MIVKVNNTYDIKIMEYLNKEPDFNLFTIGDIKRYGYDNYFLNIWADINENGEVQGVLLKYFEFLIFYSNDIGNEDRFCEIINGLDYKELSGKSDVVDILAEKLELRKKRVVNFCRLLEKDKLLDNNVNVKIRKIRFGNIKKVVKLYEIIDEFDDTTAESIKNGLRTGRGYCIMEKGKVVSMIKSTCENNTHAMIVGVGTHPDYRNKGLATKCIVKMCKELVSENKTPCLFYDNVEAGKIYRKLGFEDIGSWSMYSK